MVEAAANYRIDMLREGQLAIEYNPKTSDLGGNW